MRLTLDEQRVRIMADPECTKGAIGNGSAMLTRRISCLRVTNKTMVQIKARKGNLTIAAFARKMIEAGLVATDGGS